MLGGAERYWRTQQVAEALGVSVSTVKRWVDDGRLTATRTVGRHRLILREEAERFARQRGFAFDARRAGEAPVLDDALIERVVADLRRGRSAEARDAIRAVHEAAGAEALADRLIRPVMERVGKDWEDHNIDVFQEHRATRAVKLALMDLVQRSQEGPQQDARGPLALGATPEDDPYIMPGLLCELTLRELGWDVMNLGVNLPLASLSKAVRAHRPSLVWLSVSYLEDVESFLREYTAFHATASDCDVAVIVGGQALAPDVRSRMVAASFGERMAHLAEFARRIRPEAPAAPDRP